MLISVALASVLLVQALQARRTTGRTRHLKQDNQIQRRAYAPSTANDLIPLGSAGNYAIFTFSGISTVDGDAANGNVVNGDIGVAPIDITAITGFGAVEEGASNTPFVTGFIHAPPYTATAHDDVIYAYNVAAGKTPSGPIVTGAGTLDDGVPMTPGVYRWTGALALGVDTTLTLTGSCGDIFIFQTAGAITTGANSKVVLTGGLTAASVYWVSATSLSTGVASSFSGIILASTNVVIAGTLVGAVYSQTETALHAASISAPTALLATTQIGSVCNIATCAINSALHNGACQTCPPGFGSTGGIAPCVPCTGVNFIDKTGTCVACSSGTVSCDVNTGFGISCKPGFGTSGLACVACSGSQGSSGGPGACQDCLPLLYSVKGQCIPCATGSNSCSPSTGFSADCKSGYVGSSTSACAVCGIGKYYVSGTPAVCKSCSAGTATCTSSTQSTTCLPGFGYTGSACTACTLLPGTGSLGGTSTCISCINFTYPVSGMCTPCPPQIGNTACDSNGIGSRCSQGYVSNRGVGCLPSANYTIYMRTLDNSVSGYLTNLVGASTTSLSISIGAKSSAMKFWPPFVFSNTAPVNIISTVAYNSSSNYLYLGFRGTPGKPWQTSSVAGEQERDFTQCASPVYPGAPQGEFNQACDYSTGSSNGAGVNHFGCETTAYIVGAADFATGGRVLTTSMIDNTGQQNTCNKFYIRNDNSVFVSCVHLENTLEATMILVKTIP